jgi:hypothetical protein
MEKSILNSAARRARAEKDTPYNNNKHTTMMIQVVGTTFGALKDHTHGALQHFCGARVALVCEPHNPHDERAIAVHIAHDGTLLPVGHIGRADLDAAHKNKWVGSAWMVADIGCSASLDAVYARIVPLRIGVQGVLDMARNGDALELTYTRGSTPHETRLVEFMRMNGDNSFYATNMEGELRRFIVRCVSEITNISQALADGIQ